MKKQNKLFLLLALFALFLFSFTAYAQAATLTLSPASQTVAINEEFIINVLLDTEGVGTDGTDAIINYDADYLNISQASLGSLYDTAVTTNTSTSGKITLSAIASTGSDYAGSGTFATLTFTPLLAGSSNINFSFSSGSTTDSNVTSNQEDVLSSVSNSTITISSNGSDTNEPYQAPASGIVEITYALLGIGLGGLFISWCLKAQAG